MHLIYWFSVTHNMSCKASLPRVRQSTFSRFVPIRRMRVKPVLTIPREQCGNEINNGLLWPVGEISVSGIAPVSQLLHAAFQGGLSAGSPTTLIHLANGWDWAGLQSFYGGVFMPGGLSVDQVDIMGVSFYPFYGTNATLANLQSSLTNLVNEYGKPVVVAETDWPAVCENVTLSEPSIPVSAPGQEEWTGDIRDVLDSLPGGKGQGICESNKCLGKPAADLPLLA